MKEEEGVKARHLTVINDAEFLVFVLQRGPPLLYVSLAIKADAGYIERGWEEKIFYSQSQQNKLQMRSLTPFVIQPSLEKISNPSSIRAVTRSLNKITPEL
ncbi:hypothetical protein V1477_000931 [Vespula maculifrons]|uniref:Uncharacterized protein n=1 Tax=Vespula maculifrons TaxID=7453 RepID=A0ABD2D360_VESMC